MTARSLAIGTIEYPIRRLKSQIIEIFNFMDAYPGMNIPIYIYSGLASLSTINFLIEAIVIIDKNITFSPYGNLSDRSYINFTDKCKYIINLIF